MSDNDSKPSPYSLPSVGVPGSNPAPPGPGVLPSTSSTPPSPGPDFLSIPRGPTIITTRSVARTPAPPWAIRLGLASIAGFLILVVVLIVAVMRFVDRQDFAREIDNARLRLSAAQSAHEKLLGPGISSEQAAVFWDNLKSRNGEALGDLETALTMDGKNQEARHLYEQAKRYAQQCSADYETVQARILLEEVLVSTNAKRKRTLTEKQSHTVQKKCRAALDHCARALALEPHSAAAWMLRVHAYRLSGNSVAAKTTLKEALKLFPEDPALNKLAGHQTGP